MKILILSKREKKTRLVVLDDINIDIGEFHTSLRFNVSLTFTWNGAAEQRGVLLLVKRAEI